ncbi:hypothetical protein ID858_06655 [Xenorhabdus sp. DI]|uniref:hypothetical protein n=1 Tax=Xenorhabdus doucetiae TaxID=351671 RepID=UPI00199DD745|nr:MULTISPECIES: hypothetical protein [unclassified Xenorhabdus]MBD2783750.1 hypothetical protein [Xenorhabdus sp. 3]MBD2788184.1 hypothetical protein [Xenorhabdus sp. DI]
MKWLIGFCMILFSFAAFSKQGELDFKAWKEAGGWGIYNDKPDSHFNPLTIKKYNKNYLLAFKYIIKVLNTQNVNNDFCLIGYKFDKKNDSDGFERVIIYWKTANRLINWEVPDGDDDGQYESIIFSKPFIDISDSVVPYKEAEGAQALWAKEGVIQIIDDCELHGQKITIKPSEVKQ